MTCTLSGIEEEGLAGHLITMAVRMAVQRQLVVILQVFLKLQWVVHHNDMALMPMRRASLSVLCFDHHMRMPVS